jgi:F-type H+-transporting ATPase subunit c
MNFDLTPEQLNLLGRYFGAGLALGLGGIGAAVGMGMSAAQANAAMMRQPEHQGHLLRTMLIGQAVGSSPSIFALVIGLMILFLPVAEPDAVGGNAVAAMVGAGLAIGLGALGSGAGCGFPGAEACEGVARNPRRSGKVTQAMLIGQAVAQSPSIFALVIGVVLVINPRTGTDWSYMGIFIGSGLAMGASALGSGLGSGLTAGGGVKGMSNWPKSHGLTFRTMLVGQGVCETPAIFGLLVALIMLFAMGDATSDFVTFAKTLAAGIAMGFGGIGPGIGSGLAGMSGCSTTALRPRHDSLILRTMLIGQAVAQSTAMYALIIALLLLYIM